MVTRKMLLLHLIIAPPQRYGIHSLIAIRLKFSDQDV